MSFYSYKNANSTHCPCTLSSSEILSGLNERVCIQVQRVYDSCLYQEQLSNQRVSLVSYGLVTADHFQTLTEYLGGQYFHGGVVQVGRNIVRADTGGVDFFKEVNGHTQVHIAHTFCRIPWNVNLKN